MVWWNLLFHTEFTFTSQVFLSFDGISMQSDCSDSFVRPTKKVPAHTAVKGATVTNPKDPITV